VLVVEAGIPHGFTNVGAGRLELFCIHPNERIVQEWVAERGQARPGQG